MNRVTTAALILAGAGQIVITLSEPDFNTAIGLAIGVAFFLLAGLAATGTWSALTVVALISGLLTVAATGQLLERINSGEAEEMLRVLGFQALTLTAAVAGMLATVRSYRARHVG